jgi:hypothetical protein
VGPATLRYGIRLAQSAARKSFAHSLLNVGEMVRSMLSIPIQYFLETDSLPAFQTQGEGRRVQVNAVRHVN